MPKNSSLSSAWSDEKLKQASHDIKNELASILALCEMLEVLLPEESRVIAQPHFEKIRQRILHTSDTVTMCFQDLRKNTPNGPLRP